MTPGIALVENELSDTQRVAAAAVKTNNTNRITGVTKKVDEPTYVGIYE